MFSFAVYISFLLFTKKYIKYYSNQLNLVYKNMMNSLTPKVNRESANKSKNKIGSPIVVKSLSEVNKGAKYTLIEKFVTSACADDQLAILKSLIDQTNKLWDLNIVNFLAVVFYEAPAKHPVKCFLARHVTKYTSIQPLFIEQLSTHIMTQVSVRDDKSYGDVVPKLMTCIENFPPGAAAVKSIDFQLANYLIECFDCCFRDLRESSLSPTKKNEIFTLEHSALRILVHIVQKFDTNDGCDRSALFLSTRNCIEQLIVDEDVPMDTKCLSGILLLSVENWKTDGHNIAWMKMLTATSESYNILEHKAGQLAVYSAIATSVSMDELQSPIENSTAILVLLNKLLCIAEGAASEPALTLGVARSLLLLSKSLDVATAVGSLVADSLLVFVWTHLEFYLDSVRHLAQQVLANVLEACARAEVNEPAPLASLLTRVRALGRCRGFYWCVGRAARALGPARVLRELCSVEELLDAAAEPHLQAAVSSAISSVLSEQSRARAEEVFSQWVLPALGRVERADVTTLAALEAVLALATRLHPLVVPYMCEYMSAAGRAVLVSLVCCGAAAACRAHLPRAVLHAAAVAAADETRILALSLCAESDRSTATLSKQDLQFVVWFLRYNINAASPNFRQLMLANMKKLLKRLEDSYRVLKRSEPTAGEHYIEFVEELRELCYKSVLRGANFGRRSAALQLLVITERLQLPGYNRVWREEYVETLLLHLDDSYESNKALALQVLECCPIQLLQVIKRCICYIFGRIIAFHQKDSYSTRIQVGDILSQASSLRPAASVSAAYKLRLVLARRPELVCRHHSQGDCNDDAAYSALCVLVRQLRAELHVCSREGVAAAARRGAMFGVLHCVAAVLHTEHMRSVTWEGAWGELADELADTCVCVTDSVRHVVADASPEGYLPDGRGESEVLVEGGRPVTAQMVLICAWRSVKEASAVLGALVSLLPPIRFQSLVRRCGDHLISLLGTAQHRGAVEQAAHGFTIIAHRCWSCPSLSALPRAWLAALLAHIGNAEALPATRRGAGLPFILQALVTTELQATGQGTSFLACVTALLEHASPAPGPESAPSAERRALCANALRALFRHTALEQAVQPHVAAGLRTALHGFDADGWPERTAMCLLFSALSVRVFGVQRSREVLDVRNTLPARTFYRRHPALYDVMLDKLKAMDPLSPCPSPFPTLLLLARLYPSALDGAASNLKLAAFVPLVQRCAHSAVLKTRQLAARALAAILPPAQYFPQILVMLRLVSSRDIGRNHLHGVLLQLARLLARGGVAGGEVGVEGTLWILDQACYVITREYIGVLNLLVWRFPESIPDQTASKIQTSLELIIFSEQSPSLAGRELCLADCLYLYLILLHKEKNLKTIAKLVEKSLQHKLYEVELAALNYLLVLHGDIESDCKFLEHLRMVHDKLVLDELRRGSAYVDRLCSGLHRGRCTECRQKCLKLLTLEEDTQRRVIDKIDAGDEEVIVSLVDHIDNAHENVTHLYLENLLNFVSGRLEDPSFNTRLLLEVLRIVFAQSSADNGDRTRHVVVSYLERNVDRMMALDLRILDDAEIFEYKATIISTIVTLLEDDDDVTRQRAADVTARLTRDATLGNVTLGKVTLGDVTLAGGIIASACGELLRSYVGGMEDSAAMFVALALLDFKCEVVMMDELNDECRVFDQSERYNIFLEETVWTSACADKILQLSTAKDCLDYVLSIVNNPKYKKTLENLCNDNLALFKEMSAGLVKYDETVNPKIELFVRKLRAKCTV